MSLLPERAFSKAKGFGSQRAQNAIKVSPSNFYIWYLWSDVDTKYKQNFTVKIRPLLLQSN